MIYIIGQIIGFIYLGVFILSFQYKDKRKLMSLRIISKILASIHYLMISATSGFISQFVGIFPNYFAYKYDKDNTKKYVISSLFCLIYVVLGVLSYHNIFDILPILGSIITIIALFMKGTKYIRLSQFVISPMFLIYNIASLSYAGILIEIFVLISCIIGYLRLDKK